MKLENNYHIPVLVQAFPKKMVGQTSQRLGVRYHCYYLYSVVCQQIWRNVLPLFFPRYTGVKKTQHYTLFISNPIDVLFYFEWYRTPRRIQKGKSTKTDKADKKLNHLSFQSTEQLKNNTFLTWYRHFPRKVLF
jgi:hypothetical protein